MPPRNRPRRDGAVTENEAKRPAVLAAARPEPASSVSDQVVVPLGPVHSGS